MHRTLIKRCFRCFHHHIFQLDCGNYDFMFYGHQITQLSVIYCLVALLGHLQASDDIWHFHAKPLSSSRALLLSMCGEVKSMTPPCRITAPPCLIFAFAMARWHAYLHQCTALGWKRSASIVPLGSGLARGFRRAHMLSGIERICSIALRARVARQARASVTAPLHFLRRQSLIAP